MKLDGLNFIPFNLNQWLSEIKYDENNSYYITLWLIFCHGENFSGFYLPGYIISIELISEQRNKNGYATVNEQQTRLFWAFKLRCL